MLLSRIDYETFFQDEENDESFEFFEHMYLEIDSYTFLG